MTHSLKLALTLIAATALTACGGGDDDSAPTSSYRPTVLVSDGSAPAPNTSPGLKNAWGLAFNPKGVAWVSGNGSQSSVLFDGNGAPQALTVTLPAATRGTASPTGIVFNGSATDFAVTSADKTASAAFVFATDVGTLAGWSPKVLPTEAVTAYDDAAGGATYKGLALAQRGAANYLFATDFHNNKVDVFDASFHKLDAAEGAFHDASIPAGYAPFGIQAVGDKLFVTYAQQDAAARAQVVGAGLGIVDVFDTSGKLLAQLEKGAFLNAPWGIAQAPADFGALSNDVLVGNFGDGTVSAFDPVTYRYLGKLAQADGGAFTQKGLWGMAFGNGVQNQPKNTLFYAAGPSKTTGIYGRIDLVTTP